MESKGLCYEVRKKALGMCVMMTVLSELCIPDNTLALLVQILLDARFTVIINSEYIQLLVFTVTRYVTTRTLEHTNKICAFGIVCFMDCICYRVLLNITNIFTTGHCVVVNIFTYQNQLSRF